MSAAVLEVSGVSKDYRGLRPLRLAQLTVAAGDRVALLGFDRASAEVFVNLVTGAALPDAGEIRVFGRATSAIADSADWLATVDRFGIVSERAVLLDQLTIVQNLAMPFTLEIEPPADDIARRAGGIAADVGLPEDLWSSPVAGLNPYGQMRVRLGRALALNPDVLLLEHVSAGLQPKEAEEFGADIGALARRRGTAVVALTADTAFARAVAPRVVMLEAATGRLKDQTPGGWFGRRR